MNKIHLSNIHNFTLQQVFDRVATHLLEQGKPAMRGAVCSYRTPEGRSCAVGCLMTDEEYDERMEGAGINGEKFNHLFNGIGDDDWTSLNRGERYDDHRTLLTRLQHAHDSAANQAVHGRQWSGEEPKPFIVSVREKLKLLAEQMNLDDSVLRA